MKKIALGILGLLALAVAAVVVMAMFQPDVTHVERSRVVHADAAEIKPQLTDLKLWVAWSPWAEMDPNATWTYSDPAQGKGAWYTWEGNEDVGKGRMDVLEVSDDAVRYSLKFIEPFESEATVALTLAEHAEGTEVTWIMDSENPFVTKVFLVFADFDAMIGADFERGLGNLASKVET